jgi:hypothetical protein
MRRSLALALALGAALATDASGATHPMLIGSVGLHDAFKISLTFPNGRPVRSIPAGTYLIVVHDYSKIHNFALGSVSQNRRIFTGSVPDVGTKTYTVTLKPGTYAFACSAHPQTMNGTFVVTG